MRRPHVLTAALALVLVGAASACGSSSDTGASASSSTGAPATSAPPTTAGTTAPTAAAPEVPGQVLIRDYELLPPTITIAAAGTVTWQNSDDVDHDMISDDETTVRSGPIAPGQAYVATLPTPGTYDYYCEIHNAMKGTIVVE